MACAADAVVANKPPDLVIVGAGISGLCAGLEAARGGANVTIVDLASVFGGHAVMSSGMVCLVGTPEQRDNQVFDGPELAARDFLRFGEDADPAWVRFYAENSRHEIYDWLQKLGVKEWELYPQIIPGNSVRRQHVAKGRGVGLVSPIYEACLRQPNLSFLWNTKVTELIAESGRIAGVRLVSQRTGQTNELRAAFVILATGGFESNLELVRANWPRYFPRWTEATRVLLGSGINALGSGLELAGKAGASLSQLDHQLFYSTGLVDPRDSSGRRGLHAFNRAAIWVNAQGKRFVADGQPDPKMQMPAVLRQTPPTYWAVFDAASRPQFFVSGSDWNDTNVVQREIFANPKLAPWVKRANSLGELAQAARLPPVTLSETLERWNQMVERGADDEFNRFGRSELERPAKINTPPFYAIQFLPLARKSLGGVSVDLNCRVLDLHGQPIPGLYAVGELAGVGRINGKAAVESAPPPLPEPQVTEPDTLRAWREVLRQLIEQPRSGYVHFAKAHAVVLQRSLDCGRCHTEALPLTLTAEQLDRAALVRSCPLCHGGVQE